MAFTKAVKEKLKCRLAIEGPSGSGKSLSSLLIARGLVGESGTIAMIDTEKDSGKLFADKTDFDHASLQAPYTPERYVGLIKEAEAAGYGCIIIDSISHEWMGPGGMLEEHDKMPGNSWTNWGKINPRHDAFIEAMLNAKCHVIVTMRSKQSYVQEQGSNGKQQIKKMGLAPQQRDGMEYEFTAVIKMDITHQAEGDKDRTELFPVGQWFIPTVETGTELAKWLDSGIDPNGISVDQFEKGIDWFKDNKKKLDDLDKWFDSKEKQFILLPDDEKEEIDGYLKETMDIIEGIDAPKKAAGPKTITCNGIEVTLVECKKCPKYTECETINEVKK